MSLNLLFFIQIESARLAKFEKSRAIGFLGLFILFLVEWQLSRKYFHPIIRRFALFLSKFAKSFSDCYLRGS